MDNGKLFSGFWSRSVAVRMERRELPWKVGCRQLIVWAGGGCKGECREESQIHRGLRNKCFTAGAIRSLCLLHCDIALLPRNDHRWPQIMMIFIFVYINITLFYGNIYSVCIIIYIIMLQILHISNLFAFIIVMWSPGLNVKWGPFILPFFGQTFTECPLYSRIWSLSSLAGQAHILGLSLR